MQGENNGWLSAFSIRAWMERHKYDGQLSPRERRALENGKVSLEEIEKEIERKWMITFSE